MIFCLTHIILKSDVLREWEMSTCTLHIQAIIGIHLSRTCIPQSMNETCAMSVL